LTDLISVRDAQLRILAGFSRRDPALISLHRAYHQVLADDILATQDLPPFTNSSMDGFAVRSTDTLNALPDAPIILKVTQEIPAGFLPEKPINSGETARIMTGAPLPAGADAVIPLEEIGYTPSGDVTITSEAKTGQYLRPQGQDVSRGKIVLPAGKRLSPQDVSLLASFGYAQVKIVSPPRVVLFSSGDELVQPGQPLSTGKIYDSNQYLLTGLLQDAGAEVINLGIAHDDPEDIKQLFKISLSHHPDLIVSSAGVSVGAFDFVRQVIEANGKLDFWRVNMRPGNRSHLGIIMAHLSLDCPETRSRLLLAAWSSSCRLFATFKG
jgi:molybdopterin molybdotransferase